MVVSIVQYVIRIVL